MAVTARMATRQMATRIAMAPRRRSDRYNMTCLSLVRHGALAGACQGDSSEERLRNPLVTERHFDFVGHWHKLAVDNFRMVRRVIGVPSDRVTELALINRNGFGSDNVRVNVLRCGGRMTGLPRIRRPM